MSFPPKSIEGTRVRLRSPGIEDVFDIYEKYAQDPEVTRFMIWDPHESIEVTRDFMGRCNEAWETGKGHRAWVIEAVEDGALLGMMGFHYVERHSIEIGYVLARDYWGQGYTTAALKILINEAFATSTVDRVQAYCDVENPGSSRVMEKSGMSLEGTLRGYMKRPHLKPKLRDCLMYAILREDWEKSV